MAKFTQKTKVVDAVQWTGDNFTAIQKLLGVTNCAIDRNGGLIVHMRYGAMFVTKGNFVVVAEKDDEPLIFSEFKFNLAYSPKKK